MGCPGKRGSALLPCVDAGAASLLWAVAPLIIHCFGAFVSPLSAQSARIVIDSDRLNQELTTLATFSDSAPPAVTRIVFSDADLRARDYVKSLCLDAGLAIREDSVGNTFARWSGDRPGEA